jgi:hypothetical protein
MRLAMLPFFDVDRLEESLKDAAATPKGELQRLCGMASSMSMQACAFGDSGDAVKRNMDTCYAIVCHRLLSKTVKINHCVGFLYLLKDVTSKLTAHTTELLPQLIAILMALVTVTTVWKKALRQSEEDDVGDVDDDAEVEVAETGSVLSETKLKQVRGMCLKRLNELLEVYCAKEDEELQIAAPTQDVAVRCALSWGLSSASYLLLETGTLQNLPKISSESKKSPAVMNLIHSALQNPEFAPTVKIAFLTSEFCFMKRPDDMKDCGAKQIKRIVKTEQPGLVLGKVLECISFGTKDKSGVSPDLLMKILSIIDAIFSSDEARASNTKSPSRTPLMLLTGPGVANLLDHFERRFQSGSWTSSALSSRKLRQHELRVLSRLCDYVGEKRTMLKLDGEIK